MSDKGEGKTNPLELLTVQQVAEEKHVSTSAVYNAMKPGGPLRSSKIGKIKVLLRADVDNWQPRPRGPKKGWKEKR